MKVQVIVTLKQGVHDPQGETIRRALDQLDYGQVNDVRQGKFFELTLDVESKEQAESLAQEVAERVLSNPVLESYRVIVED